MSRDYRADFIRLYAFEAPSAEQRSALDPDSLAFCNIMAARVPDGRRLYQAIRAQGADRIVVAPELQIAPSDLAEVE